MSDALANLPPRMIRGVAALLKHGHVAPAAAEIRVNPRTLRRWMARPAFKEALRDQASSSMRVALGQLQEAAGAAVSVLRALLEDPSPYVRAQCAGHLLQFGLRACELEDVGARLAAVEAALAKPGEGGLQ